MVHNPCLKDFRQTDPKNDEGFAGWANYHKIPPCYFCIILMCIAICLIIYVCDEIYLPACVASTFIKLIYIYIFIFIYIYIIYIICISTF